MISFYQRDIAILLRFLYEYQTEQQIQQARYEHLLHYK